MKKLYEIRVSFINNTKSNILYVNLSKDERQSLRVRLMDMNTPLIIFTDDKNKEHILNKEQILSMTIAETC